MQMDSAHQITAPDKLTLRLSDDARVQLVTHNGGTILSLESIMTPSPSKEAVQYAKEGSIYYLTSNTSEPDVEARVILTSGNSVKLSFQYLGTAYGLNMQLDSDDQIKALSLKEKINLNHYQHLASFVKKSNGITSLNVNEAAYSEAPLMQTSYLTDIQPDTTVIDPLQKSADDDIAEYGAGERNRSLFLVDGDDDMGSNPDTEYEWYDNLNNIKAGVAFQAFDPVKIDAAGVFRVEAGEDPGNATLVNTGNNKRQSLLHLTLLENPQRIRSMVIRHNDLWIDAGRSFCGNDKDQKIPNRDIVIVKDWKNLSGILVGSSDRPYFLAPDRIESFVRAKNELEDALEMSSYWDADIPATWRDAIQSAEDETLKKALQDTAVSKNARQPAQDNEVFIYEDGEFTVSGPVSAKIDNRPADSTIPVASTGAQLINFSDAIIHLIDFIAGALNPPHHERTGIALSPEASLDIPQILAKNTGNSIR